MKKVYSIAKGLCIINLILFTSTLYFFLKRIIFTLKWQGTLKEAIIYISNVYHIEAILFLISLIVLFAFAILFKNQSKKEILKLLLYGLAGTLPVIVLINLNRS